MREIKELVEFLEDRVDDAACFLENRGLKPDNYLAMFKEIRETVEQSEIKPLKIRESQGEEIMQKVKDFDNRQQQPPDDGLVEKIIDIIGSNLHGSQYSFSTPRAVKEIRKLLQAKKGDEIRDKKELVELDVDEIADKNIEGITTKDCLDYTTTRINEILYKHKDGGDFDDGELRTLNHVRKLLQPRQPTGNTKELYKQWAKEMLEIHGEMTPHYWAAGESMIYWLQSRQPEKLTVTREEIKMWVQKIKHHSRNPEDTLEYELTSKGIKVVEK